MSRLRWLWDEWGIPILGALPIIAWYIYLARNPSFWGVVSFNILIGGAVGALAFSSAWLVAGLQAGLDDEPPAWWPYGLSGFLVGGWTNLTLPVVLEHGPSGDPVDTVFRASWSLGGLAVVLLAPWRGRWGAVPLLGLGWVASLLVLWGHGQARLAGVGAGLVWVIALLAYGRWIRRG